MATLTGVSISSSYTSLLKLDGNTDSTAAGNGSNAIQVKTGDNEATPLFLNTDRLGIGIQPSVPLTVNSASDHSDVAIFHAGGGTPNRGLKISTYSATNANAGVDLDAQNSTGQFTFSTAGTERMRLTSTGLGIGTDSPSSNLEVRGASTDSATGMTGILTLSAGFNDINATDQLGRINFQAPVEASGTDAILSGASIYGISEATFSASNNSTALVFATATSSSSIERMRIASGGQVGIANSNPASSWTSADDLIVGNTSQGSSGITIMTTTSGDGNLHFGDSTDGSSQAYVRYDHNQTKMIFATENVQHLFLDGSGNLGIGISDGDGKVHIHSGTAGSVTAQSSGDDLVIESSSHTGISILSPDAQKSRLYFGSTNNNNIGNIGGFYNSGAFQLFFNISGTDRFIIDGNSRISLSNNDAGGTGGTDSTSGNTLFGFLAGSSIQDTSIDNTYIGHKAGASTTTADNNVAIGARALFSTTIAGSTVAVGELAGYSVTDHGNNVYIGHTAGYHQTGEQNVFIGKDAGLGASGADGDKNVAIGKSAGASLTSGSNNTIVGRLTADALTTGSSNIVIGDSALGTATTATLNVAIGGDCMSLVPASVAIQDVVAIGQNAFKGASDTSTGANGTVALGRDSLKSLSSGSGNTAIGYQSADDVSTGYDNTALGYNALGALQTGNSNVAIGKNALDGSDNGARNVAIGNGANGVQVTTHDCVTIGHESEVSANGASNQIAIGKGATAVADNSVTLGNASVTDVYMAQDSGATVHCAGINAVADSASTFPFLFHNDGNVDNRFGIEIRAGADDASGTTRYLLATDGDGGTVGFLANTSGTFALTDGSDERLKNNIRDTSLKGIELVKKIKVRDFEWKNNDSTVNGGFIAQELKEVYPDAVVGSEDETDANGDSVMMGVSRDRLVPLLIKAVQELSAKVEELENK